MKAVYLKASDITLNVNISYTKVQAARDPRDDALS